MTKHLHEVIKYLYEVINTCKVINTCAWLYLGNGFGSDVGCLDHTI